jgi:hypothetical protein
MGGNHAADIFFVQCKSEGGFHFFDFAFKSASALPRFLSAQKQARIRRVQSA